MMQNTQTIHHVLTGVTVGGGLIEWVSLNSSFITVIVVAITSIASIGFGFWNGKSNAERNKINRRDITDAIMRDLEKAGKSEQYIEDLREAFRK